MNSDGAADKWVLFERGPCDALVFDNLGHAALHGDIVEPNCACAIVVAIVEFDVEDGSLAWDPDTMLKAAMEAADKMERPPTSNLDRTPTEGCNARKLRQEGTQYLEFLY